jgi:precorrin-3B C17-methyltransferase
VVAGYIPYLELIEDLTAGKELLASGMTKEVDRCRAAIERAAAGDVVALVSSGDSGVYGMAGLALELGSQLAPDLDIEIIPGVTAANSAAARMGAPLMLDYAVISLSDLLVSWETIRLRLEAAAAADLVTALYNPRSRKRVRQLEEAVAIFLEHRPPSTTVSVAGAVGTEEEKIEITTLGLLLDCDIDMRSVVIIGNRSSIKLDGRFITPRGYRL